MERSPSGRSTWNLLGNAEYALGNWEKAAEAYLRACELQPGVPLFLSNAARSREREGRREEAMDLYLRRPRPVCRGGFRRAFPPSPPVARWPRGTPRCAALEGKMLYREGKTEEAWRILSGLADEGKRRQRGALSPGHHPQREGAKGRGPAPTWSAPLQLEPAFPLYQFRLAETLHMLGRDPGPVLDRALELAPDDPWTNNLAGMIILERGDPAGAVAFLRKAHEAAPAEVDIGLNLSEALSLSGKEEEAFAVIDAVARAAGASAVLANQKGNLRIRQGDKAEAVAEYETAIRMDPENLVYKENCAAVCIEMDMVHRAEELLAQVEEEHPSASVYNLLGNVAVLKGELIRAELAFTAGLGLEPGNQDLQINLAMLHLQKNDYEKAKPMLLKVLAETPGHPRALRVLERARAQRETLISCAQCGREWWAPKDLPSQPGLRSAASRRRTRRRAAARNAAGSTVSGARAPASGTCASCASTAGSLSSCRRIPSNGCSPAPSTLLTRQGESVDPWLRLTKKLPSLVW